MSILQMFKIKIIEWFAEHKVIHDIHDIYRKYIEYTVAFCEKKSNFVCSTKC